MVRSLLITGLVAILLPSASGQSKPAFDIADVHVSPRSAWVKKPANAMQGGYLNAGRYEIKRATMLDLIKMAYAVDADKISGGPSWLDYDRFEVVAKAPPTTSQENLRLMLQSLLADRFGLVVAADSRPMPSYVLSAGKDQSKLKPAETGGTPGCSQDLVMGNLPSQVIRCKNVTMEAFAADLRRFSGARIGNLPLVDRTNIEGTWDIDLQYALIVNRIGGDAPAGPAPNPAAAIIEAIDKQLGLVLSLGTAPQPVLAVQRVNQQPSANPPGIEAALPPLPPPVFEVASLKPCEPGSGGSINARFEAGGRVTATCMPLMSLINDAWGLAIYERPLGVPKWLADDTTTANNITIVAKAPQGNFSGGAGAVNRDALSAMVRALLIERYQIKFHYEDRPMDTLTLTAGKPKLTKADPANRTACTRQPIPGDSLATRLVCQNITLAQFAEQMQSYDGQISYPVVDATGIEGAWDFTLTYRLNLTLPGRPVGPAGQAPDPEALPILTEAVERQLGLKLETKKQPQPVLVIDQMSDRALEN